MAMDREFQEEPGNREARFEALFSAVIANLFVFQGALHALHAEGMLTDRMLDHVFIAAQLRLNEADSPLLSTSIKAEVASHLDSLADQFRKDMPLQPAWAAEQSSKTSSKVKPQISLGPR